MRVALPSLLLALLLTLPSAASAAPCDRLNAEQKKVAKTLLKQTYPYDCCDEKLSVCLKQKKVCKLAKRLRDDICRRVGRNQKPKAIKNALDRRARSMTPSSKKATFDLSASSVAGVKGAKVQVVVYACARCPFCSKVIPTLHRLATGPMKGKISLYFRGFPIKSHKGAAEGGLAIMAAEKLGKTWPYLMHLYANYDKFDVASLPGWAAKVGLDKGKFTSAMGDRALRKLLIKAKKEGLRNGVNATPTLYINGRKYDGDMDRESLLDVLDEESDRAAKKQFCNAKSKRYFR